MGVQNAYLTVLGLLVGMFVVFMAARYAWMRNFVLVWKSIVDMLQEPTVRLSRGFLSYLYDHEAASYHGTWPGPFSHTKAPVNMSAWPNLVKKKQVKYWESSKVPIPQKDYEIIDIIKKGYDSFDLVGIMVLQSSIPGLKKRFIAEYQDTIVSCWEMGVHFFSERAQVARRQELYNCFSVLYVLARRFQDIEIPNYPQFGLANLRLWWVWNPFTVYRRARKLRESLVDFPECPESKDKVSAHGKTGETTQNTESSESYNEAELMKKYQISCEMNKKFFFKNYAYDNLEDAINFAKNQENY